VHVIEDKSKTNRIPATVNTVLWFVFWHFFARQQGADVDSSPSCQRDVPMSCEFKGSVERPGVGKRYGVERRYAHIALAAVLHETQDPMRAPVFEICKVQPAAVRVQARFL
jgi:hypothetical protein